MTRIEFTNSYTKEREVFTPAEPGRVRMYNCGPTVYGYAHIGNFRSFLLSDVLRRFLELEGFEVRQVMNITDVGHLTEDDIEAGEDKVIKAARERGLTPFEIAEEYESAFFKDAKQLRFKLALEHADKPETERREFFPRATKHIAEQLALLQTLLDRGYAYVTDKGEAYFDISSFTRYGRLSGNTLEKLNAGERVEIHPDKKSPFDFALWKVDDAHLMQWDPHARETWEGWYKKVPVHMDDRLRRGFPGWHLECSAMSMRYLTETIDIHTGGEDNVFPHHECEIAQSEAATDRQFVRYWMHVRHLLVSGKKMSKRDGTFFTIKQITDELGYRPEVLRYELIRVHYRQPQNFNIGSDALARLKEGNLAGLHLENLEAAKTNLARLNETVAKLRAPAPEAEPVFGFEKIAQKYGNEFRDALGDDLNVSEALAAVNMFVNEVNRLKLNADDSAVALDQMRIFDSVLAIMDIEEKAQEIPPEVHALVQKRAEARAAKDFAAADAIRDELANLGFEVKDTPKGADIRRLN
ncbi:MAG: cysteine--tRNA ligase [Planctomycetes bacterium]|nr:cysteine--tRNA ligase [Planctomycetota bacterium]